MLQNKNKTKFESGMTLVEMIVSVGVISVVVMLGGQLISNSSFFANLLHAKVQIHNEVSFLEHRINYFWNVRLTAGEPPPAPSPFDAGEALDKYLVVNFRRDANTSVNFDKVRFETHCGAIPADYVIANFQFPEVCGLTCPIGQAPYVLETYTYNGNASTHKYPPRLSTNTETSKAIVGLGLCAVRSGYDEVQIKISGYRKIHNSAQPVRTIFESMVLKTVRAAPGIELIHKP